MMSMIQFVYLVLLHSTDEYFVSCNSHISLYRGKVGLDAAEAQHLMDGLDWQGAVKDIHASVNWLKANGSKKVFYILFRILMDCCLKSS